MAHLRDAHLDAPLAGIRVLGRVDPPNPFPSRHRRNRLPEVADLWGAADKALPKSAGRLGSGHSLMGSTSTVAVSPALTPATRCRLLSRFIQWPRFPSGSSTVRNVCPLIVPCTTT